MKIEDLYLELGRSMTEKIVVGKESVDAEREIQDEVASLNKQLVSVREATKRKQDRIQKHIEELQEAIRLASDGVDPTLAKLTAKESLEEHRQLMKSLDNITAQKAVFNQYPSIAAQPYNPTQLYTANQTFWNKP